ncbi:alpha-2-macroglobulin [Litorimonas sp. RW-G-Af-16]|uniref:alpha-2-macroglobulin family protein n=1 Tax=Litorimonas sp. RW-G-Af-16 TaxID=3241168 RepID=UPI003AAE131F
MRKFFLGLLGFIGVFGLAGWLGYTLYSGSYDAPRRSANKVTDSAPPSAVEDLRITPTPRNTRDAAAPTETQSDPVLSYSGWEARDLGDQSQACFTFSSRLQPGAEVDLKSYVEITPKTPFSLAISDSDLCVLGLDYAKEYNVALLPGLKAVNGTKLQIRRDVEVTFGNKPAFIGFTGEGIILPRTDRSALGITSMNVDAMDLTLYRVNHRILTQTSPNSGGGALEGEYSYGSDAWGTRVEVWSGKLDVQSVSNKMITTAFDLQDKITDKGPGAYIIEAKRHTEDVEAGRGGGTRVASAWRWIISTDMALTSYRGASGLTVSVRSIDSARLQSGVRLDLVAQNNEKLAEIITDANGRAFFATALLDGGGALTPKMIMAYAENGDYAVLDLSRSPLDLTALDVTGRTGSAPIDVYAFTERGVYRPGETVHLTALMRDPTARASFDRPVTVTISKPNGSEVSRKVFEGSDAAGGVVLDYDVPNDAPRGQWSIGFDAEGLGTIRTIQFGVEDFVPQKLRLGIKADETPYRIGEKREIMLDAQFLYGAAGRGLAAEAEARIQIDPNPFPDFKDYNFGDVNKAYQEQLVMLDEGLTDDAGAFELALDIDGPEFRSPHPLRAFVTAGVAEPGGRFVRDSIFIPVRSQDSYVGIKPGFDYYADKSKPVPISLIAVNAAGARVAKTVEWTLVEEDYDYHWYREYGRWRYRRDVRDIPVTSGEIQIGVDAPAQWSRQLGYGRYRLDVTTDDGTASYGFGVGWSRGNSTTDAPDRIQIGAPSKDMTPGERFTITLNAPYAGRGDLVIANDTVQSVQAIDIPAGASEISLPFSEDWGQSVYAMVTLYTAMGEEGAAPKRAVGLAHISLDRSDQTLKVAIQAPDKIAPRQTINIGVSANNLPRGEKAYVVLTAADEGILQITKYPSPDAPGHYFPKKAFTLDVRDDYSRILDPFAAGGQIRQGGDSLGGAGLTVVPTKTVVLFSGLVPMKNGRASIPVVLPDFNGELRLMATAWSKTAIGSASQPMKVRDAVPANLALPRFLAPGDKAIATVALDNLDGGAGEYLASISAETLSIDDGTAAFDLAQGQRDQAIIPITGGALGIDTLSLSVKGPQNYTLTSTYPIQTRAPYRDVTDYQLTRLAPNESYTLDQDSFAGFLQGSAEFSLSVDTLPGLTPAPFLAALRRYPYGCSEQTTSVAMPLVFVEELGGIEGMSNVEQRRQVQKAIIRLVARQDADGAFGLWSSGDGNASPWLSLYVTDFLIKADSRGFDVPEDALKKALNAAKKLSRMEYYTSLNLNFEASNQSQDRLRAERAAYAHYNLVQGGRGDIAAIRYVHDEFADKMRSPLALAHLGAALEGMGDMRRAKLAYGLAETKLGDADEDDYYASDIRNAAAVLAVAGNTAPEGVTARVIKSLAGLDASRTNTQENSYLVQAMAKLKANTGDVSVKADGLTLSNNALSSVVSPSTQGTITNTGSDPVWVSVSVHGSPKTAPPPKRKASRFPRPSMT